MKDIIRELFCLGLLIGLVSVSGAENRSARFRGKVVAQKVGSVALVGDDGKTYPLIEDNGSRMFFKDKSLLGRPMQLSARLEKGQLRVVNVQSVIKGKVHDVYYWCANCELAYSEPGTCQCCGDPVKLVEVESDGKGEKPMLLLPR